MHRTRSPAVCSWLVCAALCLLAGVARAELSMQLRLLQREVVAGEPFQLELTAMSDEGHSPERPDLVVPSGFEVAGPRVGTRQSVSIVNFKATRQSGITATWTLMTSKPGTYRLGPASVHLGGQLYQANAVEVQVLPEGQGRRRPRRRSPLGGLDPFGPLDPFGQGGFDDLFDQMRRGSRLDRLPTAPAELVVEPTDRSAFIRAEVVPSSAVVGQQVTLRVYAYGGRGLFQEAGAATEPAFPEFLAHRIVENPTGQTVYRFEDEGTDWLVVKVREVALFPLKAGELTIGPMTFGFLGRRYGGLGQRGLLRQTEPITVQVSEPPLEGRPPGYAGDVGRFRMRAEVRPREVRAGGAISVKVEVRGEGRLPVRLKLPEQAGVQWDEPTVVEDTEITNSKVGGRKTFSYVVRLEKPGDIDLGAIRLPVFEPQRGAYRVLEEDLGRVLVSPSTKVVTAEQVEPPSAEPKLSGSLAFRSRLEPRAPRYHLIEQPWFLWALALGPLGVALSAGLRAAWRRAQRLRQSRSQALDRQALDALRRADGAASKGDSSQALAQWERALYFALEHSTGLRARGVLRSELEASLRGRGMESPLAQRCVAGLSSIEEARFAGASDLAALRQELSSLVRELCQARPAAASQPDQAGAEEGPGLRAPTLRRGA